MSRITEIMANGQHVSNIPLFIARFYNNKWYPLTGPLTNYVSALCNYNNTLIAAGDFVYANGLQVNRIAQWDGVDWKALSTGTDYSISALASFDNRLILGGVFDIAGGVNCFNIASWNGSTFGPVGGGTDGIVTCLFAYENTLIVGGQFTLAGAVTCNNIAVWDGSIWQSFGNGTNGAVLVATYFQDNLVIGGIFTDVDGTGANKVALWDGSSWHILGTGMNVRVQALTVFHDKLIAGGRFTTAGGNACNYIAQWDGISWQPLGAGTSSYVNALTVYNDELIVGGEFTTAGGITCKGIAKWDGSSWYSVGNGTENTTGGTGSVLSFTNYNNQLIVGGQFRNITDIIKPRIAGLNPVIAWDFEEDPVSTHQTAYEIRIKSSRTSWGTSSFSGDIVNSLVTSEQNFYEHSAQNLVRGTRYYGQMRVQDQEAVVSPWNMFWFEVNSLPIASNVIIIPTHPTTSDSLEVFYSYFDQDGDAEYGSKIRWFKNNIVQPQYDDLCILPISALHAGDSWTVKVVPNDGLEFGAVAESSAVIVTEALPNINNAKIYPTDANIDDILEVKYNLVETEYIIPTGTPIYEWYVNGILIENSNSQYIRLDLNPNDLVTAKIKLTDGESIFGEITSGPLVISDVPWYIYDLEISGKRSNVYIADLSPYLEWKTHKTKDINDKPNFLRVLVTKTPSQDGAIFDTGYIEYDTNSYIIPSGILERGQKYYIHVGVSDSTPFETERYVSNSVTILGSSWAENVDNSIGWTIEFGLQLGAVLWPENSTEDPKAIVYINDGTYFCSITLSNRYITLLGNSPITYDFPVNVSSLQSPKQFRISGKGSHIKIVMDETIIIDESNGLNNASNLKQIEYGDLNGNTINETFWQYFRYSTLGAFDIGSFPNHDVFYFKSLSRLSDGSIEYLFQNYISFTPNDPTMSGKILLFDPTSPNLRLPTVTKNYSPITTIYVDQNRNKYIGTPNGVNAIYGEKHDPDYELTTSGGENILGKDFDRISSVPIDKLPLVEPNMISGWFTLDTTYRALGIPGAPFATGDEYEPYIPTIFSHALHYYTQRVHGHAWYDSVDNTKGWQTSFSFRLDTLEQDNPSELNFSGTPMGGGGGGSSGSGSHPIGGGSTGSSSGSSVSDSGGSVFVAAWDPPTVEPADDPTELTHLAGFGIYVNDGTYQEIIYFYPDRIRLFYANVYVPINTTVARDYRITGKDTNLQIYQRLTDAPVGAWELTVDASGLFNTPAAKTGNSHKPQVAIDSNGNYHCVWHDDGNARSQILYSKFNGTSWSNPELVTDSYFNLRNPSIAIDSQNKIWIVYEDTSWGRTEIACSVKDDAGWNPKIRITNAKSDKENPNVLVDSFNTVHVVWEDNRNGDKEIFWAYWNNNSKAWISSAQFGTDTAIMQQLENDPYVVGAVCYKHPKLSFLYPNVWLTCEGFSETTNTSVIYLSFRNIDNGQWVSQGVPYLDANGNVVAIGTSIILSGLDRHCENPSIASNPALDRIIVTWEDHVGTNSQIWGVGLREDGSIINGPIQITNRSHNCTNPANGFVGLYGMIFFESDNYIYSSYWDYALLSFYGSATGGEDRKVSLSEQSWQPALPQYVVTNTVEMCYSFLKHGSHDIQDQEFPKFYLIGSADMEQINTGPGTTSTIKLNEMLVSALDTKEFAFGDFAENVGILAHWKDIKMYFGYNARPPYITKYNKSSVSNWPDNRINDIFVDKYGNLIVATFGGLLYHNIYTGHLTNIDGRTPDGQEGDCTPETCLLKGKIITAVEWGKNGIWYVGATDGGYFTYTAGQKWERFDSIPQDAIVNDIAVNKNGKGIYATSKGIYVVDPNDPSSDVHLDLPSVTNFGQSIRAIAVDDNNIIWAGNDDGLLRIENYNYFLLFNTGSGMRTNYVTSIVVVSRYVRYIGTAAGIHLMNGSRFLDINTSNHDLVNNNISALQWVAETNSLWVGCLNTLHEIVFRDPNYGIISDEIVHYSEGEIITENLHDMDTRYVLDTSLLGQTAGLETVKLSNETAKVYINKNLIDFGYTLNDAGNLVKFSCNLLDSDDVEIELSNMFQLFSKFDQTHAEQEVYGFKKTNIIKLDETPNNKLILLSDIDKSELLMYAGEYSLPFTTILIDREPPQGAFAKTQILSRTRLKFRVIAIDNLSGIDGYILSNYENFTSDGATPLPYSTLPMDGLVNHDLEEGLTTVTTVLNFDSGVGRALATWTNTDTKKTYLYAGTSAPAQVFKYDPDTDEWTLLGVLDAVHPQREITRMKEIGGIVYIATGLTGGNGAVYRIANGDTLDVSPAMSIPASHITSIASGLNGIIYFGDNTGNIYEYRAGVYDVKYQGVAQKINSLDSWDKYLLVGTGNNSRVYLFNTETNDNLIIFSGSEQDISDVFIENQTAANISDVITYLASGEFTTIYRGKLDDFSFVKSYSSYAKTIHRLGKANKSLLTIGSTGGSTDIQTIAAIGSDMFKHNDLGWEYFYGHDEDIRDFIQYTSNGIDGVFVISDSKVNKWTNLISQKIVYLKLKDKAGNVSATPTTLPQCPTGQEPPGTVVYCFNYAYSVSIDDLKGFINQSRIVDVDEYGAVTFSYDSPNDRVFYGGDKIDQEIGIYTSQIFNGSNDLVSWRTIQWESTEPTGTSVSIQIRHAKTESDIENAEWSTNLIPDVNKKAAIEYITDQYLQFRAILTSNVRNLSPSLSSVIIRNVTAQSSHFFTTNFIMPSRPIKGILTANTFIPVHADIIFGVNTKNTTDFSDYQIIEPNRLFNLPQTQFGDNLRIGAKLLSPGIGDLQPPVNEYDPYSGSYTCVINFAFTNHTAAASNYHFRIRFYNDIFRTQLAHTFFTGNDQTGWNYGAGANIFPALGLLISPSESQTLSFTPLDMVDTSQIWYLVIDAYDGTSYTEIFNDKSYVCADCHILNEHGIVATYYSTGLPPLTTVPTFSQYTPDQVVIEDNIDFAPATGNWMTTTGQILTGFSENFAVRFRGRLQVAVAGEYSFILQSSDGSRLFIDSEEVIDFDGIHSFTSKSGNIYLSEGLHDLEIHYFKATGSHGLQLRWIVPGSSTESIVPADNIFHAVASEYCEAEIPKIFNFAVLFELENGESVKLNLT